MHARLGLHAGAEGGRGVPELLVGDESGNEHLARLVGAEPLEVVIVLLDAPARQVVGDERGGLDVEQRGRHEHEVARDIQVELAHALHLGEVLVCHLGDGDGADVHALAAHELQQQVERPRVCLGLDAVAHARPPA